MVQPPVPERVAGQGAVAEVAWLGAGLKALVVPAVGKRPISLQLVTPGVGGEGGIDFSPGHIPMPVDVPFGHGVGNSLKAEHPHQPIEDHTSVMVLDCCNQASVDCLVAQIVDTGNLTGDTADPADKEPGGRASFHDQAGEWATGSSRQINATNRR